MCSRRIPSEQWAAAKRLDDHRKTALRHGLHLGDFTLIPLDEVTHGMSGDALARRAVDGLSIPAVLGGDRWDGWLTESAVNATPEQVLQAIDDLSETLDLASRPRVLVPAAHN
jgi:hypothetical protein